MQQKKKWGKYDTQEDHQHTTKHKLKGQDSIQLNNNQTRNMQDQQKGDISMHLNKNIHTNRFD